MWCYARSVLVSKKWQVYVFPGPLTVDVSFPSILPLQRYNPDLGGSETGQLTVNEKAEYIGKKDESVDERKQQAADLKNICNLMFDMNETWMMQVFCFCTYIDMLKGMSFL